MKILEFTKTNNEEIIRQAVMTLQEGGILIYPTETCYGIGVDATNPKAIEKLYQYKTRREGKPLSVAVADKEMAQEYAEINDIAENLYENYLPGPLTVVSKGLHKVAPGVESEFGTLGIRIPDYNLIRDIVKAFGKPITATSANISYKPRPYSIERFIKDLPAKHDELVDLIIDAGELPKNEPSTVVDTTMNNLNVMREGTARFNADISDDKVILKANTKSTEETIDFGSLVMLKHVDVPLERPLLIALRGELGAGKTQFAKGIGRYLKINETISSPTFTIIDEYEYTLGDRKGKFAHIDTWRVNGAEELARLDLEGQFRKGNIIAIEWADKFYSEIIEYAAKSGALILKVDLKYVSIDEREISVYKER